jgi:hypothetical protein
VDAFNAATAWVAERDGPFLVDLCAAGLAAARRRARRRW